MLLLWIPVADAGAEPLDLDDPRPRWVSVRFEVSGPDAPGRLDATYSPPYLAWLELAGPGRLRLAIDGDVVADRLFAGQEPKPGSFSDFVWELDADTGVVTSAVLSGVLMRTLDWGFFETRVETRIEIEMASDRPAGFLEPSWLLGQRFRRYCSDRATPGCTVVDPEHYDPETGYVNAVGSLAARSHGLEVETFAAFGEAVFSEFASWESPWRPVARGNEQAPRELESVSAAPALR